MSMPAAIVPGVGRSMGLATFLLNVGDTLAGRS